jgi:hypothetical protein
MAADLGVGEGPLDPVPVLQACRTGRAAVDVVVLQVDERHRGGQFQVVPGPVALDEVVLDHPVALAVELEAGPARGG